MNILFFVPFNSRSRDNESLMEAFIKEGHVVYLLSIAAPGILHEKATEKGVITASSHHVYSQRKIIYYFRQLFFLISFCKKNKIQLVYSHLEAASLIAVFAQYFIKAKVVACRHTVEEPHLSKNRNFILGNKIVYTLAKNIIVVAQRAKTFMIEQEGINAHKIHVINLGYNFDLYEKVNVTESQKIREQYKTEILLITICRLLPAKRPDISIKVLSELLKAGTDAKLIILGAGYMKEELQNMIQSLNLQNKALLVGQVNNVMDYLAAADIMIHPSILDASSVVSKEAGLLSKPIMVCKGVGDFEDYLVNKNNAILVDKNNPVPEMVEAVQELSKNDPLKKEMGQALHQLVFDLFDIKNIIKEYDRLHAQLFKV